jgi:hypothetical protein
MTVNRREPAVWAVGIVCAASLAIAAQHPLARMIGTEVDIPPVAVATTAVTGAVAASTRAASAAHPWVEPAPAHAPVDPFAPLYGRAVGGRTHALRGPSCSGRTHRVRPGESLWSIAGSGWSKVYAGNRAAVGPNPSLLLVGVQLCLAK